MKIFIRVDGGRTIGIGHVMRMIVLARKLKKNNQVIFLCKTNSGKKFEAGINKIKEMKFQIIEIKDTDVVKDILKVQNEYKADVLITDSYDVDEEYFNVLKPYFKVTGYVDDVNKCYMNVDFIINQNINAEKLKYSKTTPKDTKLFLGLKFSMIRDEFKKAYKKKVEKEYVEDILLTLGGMDDYNNTIRILNNLTSLNQKIHVVLGSAFDEGVINEIYDFSKQYGNIHVYENAIMSDLMSICDIAISGCGSTIYELCAMNVPSLGIVVAENQREVAEMMKEKKIIYDIICHKQLDDGKILKLVINLIDDNNLRRKIKGNSMDIVNLYGTDELVACIEKLCIEK
ncbi:UDP-2,4-diacetamido-2,4,6-trideoxy-beta-L-altropyranose hydrolase [Clostridium butyricum]|uniref:UDP-2,4-diacetamido-2,4, 6-trideoxy-beta-L-altropyranose hydrolase n=1 Tax=Clostridium butyricum TaxID=1492 RepID=UPI00374E9FF4